jgi:hypothetical protein
MASNKSFINKLCFGLVIVFCLVSFTSYAQEDDGAEAASEGELFNTAPAPKATKGSGGKEGGVLDFEGETIEGQRKRPDLFLQTEIQNLTLDAILYLRKDFNDFHMVDKSRRPGYVERKARKRK